MVAALAEAGGAHTLDDFAATASDVGTDPVSGSYRGTDLLEHPPNGQGATAILLANILSQFDLAAMDPWGAERAHLEAEATKLAYDARNRFLADARPHDPGLAHMLSARDGRAAGRADRPAARPARRRIAPREAVHRDTVYITVVDRDRMAVSLIYSIFHAFGSGIASARFGILFHNRGAGFTLERGHPNEIGPRQAADAHDHPGDAAHAGQVGMPFGVMGGAVPGRRATRASSATSSISGMDPQAAIDAPRLLLRKTGEVQGRARLSRGGARRAGRARPHRRRARSADRRRAGDPHRRRAADAGRRLRPAQGRLRTGLLGRVGRGSSGCAKIARSRPERPTVGPCGRTRRGRRRRFGGASTARPLPRLLGGVFRARFRQIARRCATTAGAAVRWR